MSLYTVYFSSPFRLSGLSCCLFILIKAWPPTDDWLNYIKLKGKGVQYLCLPLRSVNIHGGTTLEGQIDVVKQSQMGLFVSDQRQINAFMAIRSSYTTSQSRKSMAGSVNVCLTWFVDLRFSWSSVFVFPKFEIPGKRSYYTILITSDACCFSKNLEFYLAIDKMAENPTLRRENQAVL